jgi:hypothetical protein
LQDTSSFFPLFSFQAKWNNYIMMPLLTLHESARLLQIKNRFLLYDKWRFFSLLFCALRENRQELQWHCMRGWC